MATSNVSNLDLVEQATIDDVEFIAKSCQFAERAHTGIGYFDLLLSKHQGCDISKVLEYVCEHDTNSILHYSKFLVIRDIQTKKAVSALSGFMSPQFGIASAKPGISSAMHSIFDLPEDECRETWSNVSFLPYPKNTWIIEAVFTDPGHRGKGYASMLLNAMFEKGRTATCIPVNGSGTGEGSASPSCQQCFICCADGNDSAMQLYNKNKFIRLGAGSGTSPTCLEKLGSKGFHVLERKY